MSDLAHAWILDTRVIGRRALVYDQLDSTNTLALSHASDPDKHGHAFLAREQSAGRGQYGRSWQAPPGSSVLMSVLLFPPRELRRPPLLTAWAAVSVCETIAVMTNLDAAIKWPNDVLVNGKKVCGILIEQRTTGRVDHPLASIVGIGLNVTQPASLFIAAGLPDAASLASLSGVPLGFEEVAIELLGQLDRRYHAMRADGTDVVESLWTRRLGVLGQLVVVDAGNEQHRGRLLELTFAGLVLETARGVVQLAPEFVKHVRRTD